MRGQIPADVHLSIVRRKHLRLGAFLYMACLYCIKRKPSLVVHSLPHRDFFGAEHSLRPSFFTLRHIQSDGVSDATIHSVRPTAPHKGLSDFSFAKLAQAAFCKGTPCLAQKIFQDFGVQLPLVQILFQPLRGEIFVGFPLHFHAFSLLATLCT